MLAKHYNPNDFEQKIYKLWQDNGVFTAGVKVADNTVDKAGDNTGTDTQAEPYCIVIPPPNVTGSLHVGHALNNTMQDILIRFERMRGKDVLWQPGTDHASIAVQMLVEKKLREEGEPDRHTLGREVFIDRIWQWKNHYGNKITRQLQRLGASCDWSRERFTMDPQLSAAVIKTFVRLYNENLIYKDKRLVNWDCHLLTAVSDLEVEPKDSNGKLWYFEYPLADNSGRYITIATTRPETMLGDTAIAVNPEDERYKSMIGKTVRLPLTGRIVPIIADSYPDPTAGSGALKVTPAHDFNDFDIGKRHNLPMISVMDKQARIFLADNADFLADLEQDNDLDQLIAELDGLDRFVARTKIVEMMDELGLIAKIEDHYHTLPYSSRSETLIEPMLTDQWYVDAKTLAQPAIAAVKNGDIEFIPDNWQKTYFMWMDNIQPWCISRQLWWGHRIPAWYGPDGHIFVAHDYDEAFDQALNHYGGEVELTQDEDVLDTWFSSSLWPLSTLGWPDDTPELQKYYPTNVIVTGFDIIFFWIARMIMMGLHLKGEVPFRQVYFNALLRDENGQKMSKTKGNVIDPLTVIDTYGADALRFTLSSLAAQGRDIRLDEARIAGYRNFATKLWNAVRFLEMNDCQCEYDFKPENLVLGINHWLVSRINDVVIEVTGKLEEYRFNEASMAIYNFVWREFCDWYLELSKPIFNGQHEDYITELRQIAAWGRNVILRLLHPFMPFISEEIWQLTGGEGILATTSWPHDIAKISIDQKRVDDISWLIDLVSNIRSTRADAGIVPATKITIQAVNPPIVVKQRLEIYQLYIKRLARVADIDIANQLANDADHASFIVNGITYAIAMVDGIDAAAEIKRLEAERTRAMIDIKASESKLNNTEFMAKAPEKVINIQKQRLINAQDTLARIEGELARYK